MVQMAKDSCNHSQSSAIIHRVVQSENLGDELTTMQLRLSWFDLN